MIVNSAYMYMGKSVKNPYLWSDGKVNVPYEVRSGNPTFDSTNNKFNMPVNSSIQFTINATDYTKIVVNFTGFQTTGIGADLTYVIRVGSSNLLANDTGRQIGDYEFEFTIPPAARAENTLLILSVSYNKAVLNSIKMA